MQTQKQLEARMAMERRMVRRLIRTAIAAGWAIRGVNDGEEFQSVTTEHAIMDAVFSVDEASIFFKKGEAKGSAYIVLGNDGWDCIADNTIGALFVEEVMNPMDAYSDKLCLGAA